jgi:uncharacterized protein (DUF1778 family)
MKGVAMSRTTTKERDKMVSMRVPQAEWDLIDRAATASGKSRTAFVLDAAKRQAGDVLKEQTLFSFTADEWSELTAALDAPVSTAERRKVAKLLGETPLWERDA